MKTLIVDDEALARRRIRLLLEQETDVQSIGECGDGEEAVRRIRDERPDLVFLDVQIPEMDAFEVIRAVGAGRFPFVVFVTAFDQYALRAFDVQACDYLLKPFADERFCRSLERARARSRGEKFDDLSERLSALLDRMPGAGVPLARLALRSNGGVRFLDVEDIDWIEADGKGVRVHAAGEVYLLRESIGRLEEKLDGSRFLRVHRSAIVHIERIRSIEGPADGGQLVTLKDQTRLPLSRGNRVKVFDLVASGSLARGA